MSDENSSIVTTINGIELDISRNMFDSDDTPVQQELPVINFDGFSYQGAQDIVAYYGQQEFIQIAEDRIAQLKVLFSEEDINTISKTGSTLQAFSAKAHAFVSGAADACNMTYESMYLAYAAEEACFAHMVKEYRPLLGIDPKALPARCSVGGWSNGLLWENCDNSADFNGRTMLWRSKDFMAVNLGSPFFFSLAMTPTAASANNTNDAFDDSYTLDGIPQSLLIAHMLHEDKTVEQMIANIDNYKMNAAGAVTVVDNQQRIATFEFNNKGNRVIEPQSQRDYLAHTNHPIHLYDHIVNTMSDGDERAASTTFKYTTWRLDAAENFLKFSPEQTPQALMTLARQKPVEFAACRGDDFMTTASVIWDLPNACAYVAPYRPSLPPVAG